MWKVLLPIKAINAPPCIACNCVRNCAPSVNVCVNFYCANITIIMRHGCRYECAVTYGQLSRWHCSPIERVMNEPRKMETKQSDWLMHPDLSCMVASVVRIIYLITTSLISRKQLRILYHFSWIINQLGILLE